MIFDDVRALQDLANFDQQNLLYVGFGSIWFVDFALAHRILKARDLISVEGDLIGYERAKFNKPFSCVTVESGCSGLVLPKLYKREKLRDRPWMMWLDYDYGFDESVAEDVQAALENLPPNSVFLITFNAAGSRYGQKPRDREQRLRAIFGDAVPSVVPRSRLDKEPFVELIKGCALDYMKSIAFDLARPGGFITAFEIAYRDQSPMVTVGGILPSPGAAVEVSAACASTSWKSRPKGIVAAPHLTAKEAVVLQAQLPNGVLDRPRVRQLGFDLDDEQIEAFRRFYLFYPSFAQVIT